MKTFVINLAKAWAESIGKNGKGSSPIYGMGPVDQHSQLQLWLDGPADKLFTVLSVKNDVKTEALHDDIVDGLGVDYLQGRSLADLMNASCRATTETLIAKGRPTRTIEMNEVSVSSMGAVMMHYMLETVFSAHLLGVDAFDQPAVEDGKVLARQYLQNQG